MAVLSVRSGQINVDTAGTAEQFTTTYTKIKALIVRADPNNAGAVFVGNDAAGDVTSANGFQLDPGDTIWFYAKGEDFLQLTSFWFDAATNGDDIHLVYFV